MVIKSFVAGGIFVPALLTIDKKIEGDQYLFYSSSPADPTVFYPTNEAADANAGSSNTGNTTCFALVCNKASVRIHVIYEIMKCIFLNIMKHLPIIIYIYFCFQNNYFQGN